MEEMNLLQYCEQNGKAELIRQWSVPENKGFDPLKTGFASHKKIWWICEKGHKWQAMVSDRVKKDAGCPYCANRKAWPGYNDLASTYPGLAAQWHPTKNGDLTPEMVTYGSDKNVWWQCELGHEWKATVGNRATKGQGCPFCAGKKAWPGFNDLATLEPQLMKEWHPFFNLGVRPETLRPGSGKKIWWKCPEGHEWEAVVANRTKRGSGCPFCAGNMAKGKAIEWAAYAVRKEAGMEAEGTGIPAAGITAPGAGGYRNPAEKVGYHPLPCMETNKGGWMKKREKAEVDETWKREQSVLARRTSVNLK